MNLNDGIINRISDELLTSVTSNCIKKAKLTDKRNKTKSPILIDLISEHTHEELNVEQESSEPKKCSCSYHTDYDKPQNLNLPADATSHIKLQKELKFLRVITWLKSCIERGSDVSADDFRLLLKPFSTSCERNSENEPIILKIQKRTLEKEEDDDCQVMKVILNGKEITNNEEPKKKPVKRVKKSVLPEQDLEASQCSPLISFGEDSIPKSLYSEINSVTDSGIDIVTFINSNLECELSHEEIHSEGSSSQSSLNQADYISFFKKPDDAKILESPKQNYTISSDQLMLSHEKCQLDNFALTIVREFLDEFNSDKIDDNIFKNKELIVEAFQTIGDFLNHLERTKNNNITMAHLFIKLIISTITKAFDISLHKNLTNFKAQLYVSMILELNKSLKIIKETLNFLITQLFDLLDEASHTVDIRVKKSVERHEYIILYGLEIAIKKFCAMINCEVVKTKNQDLSTNINAIWRRRLIAHYDPTCNNQRVLPEEDLKEFLITNLNKLFGIYKSKNNLKSEWVCKLIHLLK